MARFWRDNTLLKGDLKKHKNLPKYVGAIGGQTTPFLRRKN